MEDDVEVELALEKQLNLAHEIFWPQEEMTDPPAQVSGSGSVQPEGSQQLGQSRGSIQGSIQGPSRGSIRESQGPSEGSVPPPSILLQS